MRWANFLSAESFVPWWWALENCVILHYFSALDPGPASVCANFPGPIAISVSPVWGLYLSLLLLLCLLGLWQTWGRSTVSVSVLLPCFHFLLRCPRYRRVFQVLFLYLCLLWMHFCIVKMFTFFKNLHWLPLSLFSPFLLLLFLSASSTHMASIFMLIVFYQILFTSITLPTSSSLLLIVLKCYLILLISTHSALWSLYISIHSFASRHSFESWHSYLLYLLDG